MRTVILMIAAATMFLTTGCIGRAVSEGIGKVTGPKAVVVPVKPVSYNKHDLALVEYTRFEVQPFTDDFGGRTPPQVLTGLPAEVNHVLAQKGIFSRPGGKTLIIRGKILSYEPATTVDQAFGPFEELVARVYFVDKDSGQVIGEYNCIGRSKETVNQGVPKKMQGLAEAIVNAILQHYPSPKEK